ncbi:hypothetical protein J2Z69_000662 [Paenibacillus shirakamiensis]|uniref:HNH endonuclease n=1 Tax=Paenibacillus shirakamiensis TaxID=1265935 RepID=A0ABS4JD62_9BACL|nr:hypothetical protein [Paenibacillus shirakamiensis]MBP1999643.1 hypothetical protein [Paenibacillus shirakamiensis]
MIEKIMELKSIYPDYICDFIVAICIASPEEFRYQLKKAESNSKRKDIGNSKYNYWIAANLTDIRFRDSLNQGLFSYYYCMANLSLVPIDQIVFEHFIPKLQVPGNIVSACRPCDKFKHDRNPDDFVNMIKDEKIIENDKYVKTKEQKKKLLHFAPLVASRTGNMEIWKNKMIDIAKEDYKIDFSIMHNGPVRYQYAALYRKRWGIYK